VNTALSGWTLTNEPRRFTASDYAAAREWLANRARGRSDVAAVVEYGHCGTPGLSDIDAIVVLNDQPQPDIADWLDRRHWPDAVAAVLDYATLMVMSEEGFAGLHMWDDVVITPLGGRPLQIDLVPERDLLFVEGCRVLDWLPWHVMRLRRLERTRQVPIRWTLGLLHSLTYSVRRLDDVFRLQRPLWQEYAHRVAQVRRSWFEAASGSADCVELIGLGRQVAEEALAAFCAVIGEEPRWYGQYEEAGADFHVPGADIVPIGRRPADLPGVLHRHFAAYGRGDGRISAGIRSALLARGDETPADCVGPDLDRVLRRRMAICDGWADFLSANGFSAGLFKFAWFYRR
jgi:hypothetical protein